MVDAIQFLARRGTALAPASADALAGMVLWCDVSSYAVAADGSWGYIDLPTRRVHIWHGDWIVYDEGRPVHVGRAQPKPVPEDLGEPFRYCAECGNEEKDHHDEDGHVITTCPGYTPLPRPVREMLAELHRERGRLDWLEDNISYIMLGANYARGRRCSEILNSRGHGWRGGALRQVVDERLERETHA